MIMKLKGFIFTAVAAVMAFAACQKEPALDTSKLELSQTTMVFEKAGGSQTLTIAAGRVWQAKFAESVDWVTVTPKTGQASADPQTITVTVLPYEGYYRSTTITFDAGLFKQTLRVTQKGDIESVETAALDPAKIYTFKKVDKNLKDGQWYVMVASKNNKLWACNAPSSDASNYSKGFAYPKGIEVEDPAGTVMVSGGAAYLFSLSADGFTIMNNEKDEYILQAGNYGSLNLANAPGAGAYWDIAKNDDGTFKINNTTVSKWIVMQSSYSSFGITKSEDGGSMPWLYEFAGEDYEPEYTEVSIDQFYTTTDPYLTVKAQVVALGDETMVLNDGGDKSLYVYVGKDPSVEVGDVVKVDGLKSTYGKDDAGYTPLSQLKNVTITKIDEAITAKPATPIVLTGAQIDAPYSSAETSFIQVEATVAVDGDFINLELDGETLGSVVDSEVGTSLPEGVRLTLTGYYAGINPKGYFCILPTAYQTSNTPFFNVPATSLEVSASATSAAITVKGNVAWTAASETDGFTIDKASGEGEATITVSFAANETEEAKTATVKVSTTAEVATKEFIVTITQKAAAAAGSVEMIDRIADLTEGEYYMAGYLTNYSYSGTDYDWSSTPYHSWTGVVKSGKLVTVTSSYEDNVLSPTSGELSLMKLVSVDGKQNAYYIMYEDKYLTTTSYTENHKLELGSNKTEWVASDHSKGGIQFTSTDGDKSVVLATAGATSDLIRAYKSTSTSSFKYGLVFFKQN